MFTNENISLYIVTFYSFESNSAPYILKQSCDKAIKFHNLVSIITRSCYIAIPSEIA